MQVETDFSPNTHAVKALLLTLSSNPNEFTCCPFRLSEFMAVAFSAAKRSTCSPTGRRLARRALLMSLYALLNECMTPMDARLLLLRMRQPVVDRTVIEVRLDAVEALCARHDVSLPVRDTLRQLPDVV
jgi:DNA mismatch repair ATPase MutS